jgi:hypothetical protein
VTTGPMHIFKKATQIARINQNQHLANLRRNLPVHPIHKLVFFRNRFGRRSVLGTFFLK